MGRMYIPKGVSYLSSPHQHPILIRIRLILVLADICLALLVAQFSLHLNKPVCTSLLPALCQWSGGGRGGGCGLRCGPRPAVSLPLLSPGRPA